MKPKRKPNFEDPHVVQHEAYEEYAKLLIQTRRQDAIQILADTFELIDDVQALRRNVRWYTHK
jgi:hypothetical protein